MGTISNPIKLSHEKDHQDSMPGLHNVSLNDGGYMPCFVLLPAVMCYSWSDQLGEVDSCLSLRRVLIQDQHKLPQLQLEL